MGNVLSMVGHICNLKIQVIRAASVKMIIFWNIAPCSLSAADRRFGGAYCLNCQGDKSQLLFVMMEAV